VPDSSSGSGIEKTSGLVNQHGCMLNLLRPTETMFICHFVSLAASIHVEMPFPFLEREAKSYGSGIWLGCSIKLIHNCTQYLSG
jgi:hypothetical protein